MAKNPFRNLSPEKRRLAEFSELIMSAYPHNKIAVEGEVEWMQRWLRTVSPDNPLFKNNDAWNQDLMKLGVVHPARPLDRARTRKISAYIWEREGQEPSFDDLLIYLQSEDKKAQNMITGHLNILKKKNKLARKRSKISRKRGCR